MILVDLDQINETVLKQLCAEHCPESRTLDFKRSAPEGNDRGKQEFLKDVCAMANSDGGDLVYGIDEANGGAAAISPITTESEDALRRRLGQLLDSGLEPRVVGIRMHAVKTGGGFVLVLRVPASFDGPHRYYFNTGLSKFVMRNGTHTSELTYDQLRSAFDRTATLAERARTFLSNRLATIAARETSFPMIDGPICVLHLIPMASIASRKQVDVRSIYYDIGRLMFADWGGGKRNMNLDGVLAYPMIENGGVPAYTQVFRNGLFEAAHHGGFLTSGQATRIPSRTVAEFLRAATIRSLETVSFLGLSGPAILGWAMLDVHGAEFATGNSHGNKRMSDRMEMALPETWLENMSGIANIDEVIRPMFDTLWQCFGIEQCSEYRDDGTWIEK